MRVVRALFLTLMVVLLAAGLLVAQIGLAARLTVMSPRFVIGTMDRLGLYEPVIDAAAAAAAPPPGSASSSGAAIVISAAKQALAPQLVIQTLDEALSNAVRLIREPAGPHRLDVNLFAVREAFLAALLQAGQEHHATQSQLRQLEKDIRVQMPDTVDLVELWQLDTASLAAFSRAYSLAVRGLMVAVAAAVVLVALIIVIGRRALGAWLSAPLLISGCAMLGLAATGAFFGLPWAARAGELQQALPSALDVNVILDAGSKLGHAVVRICGVIAVCVLAVGCAVLLVHRFSGRAPASVPSHEHGRLGR